LYIWQRIINQNIQGGQKTKLKKWMIQWWNGKMNSAVLFQGKKSKWSKDTRRNAQYAWS
jgi:hypothetical protein